MNVSSKQEHSETIFRMDSMEIDDDMYLDRKFTMQGLITEGTVSTWKHMDGQNI